MKINRAVTKICILCLLGAAGCGEKKAENQHPPKPKKPEGSITSVPVDKVIQETNKLEPRTEPDIDLTSRDSDATPPPNRPIPRLGPPQSPTPAPAPNPSLATAPAAVPPAPSTPAPTYGRREMDPKQPALSPDDIFRQFASGFDGDDIIHQVQKRGFTGYSDPSDRVMLQKQGVPEQTLLFLDQPENQLSQSALENYVKMSSAKGIDPVLWVRSEIESFKAGPAVSPQMQDFLKQQEAICKIIENLRAQQRKLAAENKADAKLSLRICLLEQRLADRQSSTK